MRQKMGIGISAVQIGILKKIIAVEYLPENSDEETVPLTILVNPKITNFSIEKQIIEEGCLSLPGVELPVERPKKITVLAQDTDGNRVKLRATGLLARVIQHEIDHLNGEIFVEKTKIDFPYKDKKIKLAFFGSSDFSLPALYFFYNNPFFEIKTVITETDKPAGRGQQVAISPVKKYALENKIPILQPMFIRERKDGTGKNESAEFANDLNALDLDICLVASYGKIIPSGLLKIPKYGFVNIHPSLLPKYRGATPLQSTILNGDKNSGITIIKMDEGMDTGPIISQVEVEIPSNITLKELSRELAIIGAETALFSVIKYILNLIKPISQKGNAILCSMIKKEDGFVDLAKDDPIIIERKIRAYNPWPGVYTLIKSKAGAVKETTVLKITAAHIENGKIIIDKVKPEGKNEMDYKSYILGNSPLI
jgi:methionyl-tRNA formyltransferase